jgi:hypothetical protein
MVQPVAAAGRTQLFLVLSALATGASWLFYFRALQSGELAKVAVVDKFSVVLVIVLAYLCWASGPACGVERHRPGAGRGDRAGDEEVAALNRPEGEQDAGRSTRYV